MRLEEIQRHRIALAGLRRWLANVKRDEVEGLAIAMGYEHKPKRTGEPRYDKAGRDPISIPSHRTLNKWTLKGILDRLEADLDESEEENSRGD